MSRSSIGNVHWLKVFGPAIGVFLVSMACAAVIVIVDAGPEAYGILVVLSAAAGGWFGAHPIAHEIYLRQERSRQS